MTRAPEGGPHLAHVRHDRGHVLGRPLVAPAVVQDDCAHHLTSASRDSPLIRRQAMSATARIRSS